MLKAEPNTDRPQPGPFEQEINQRRSLVEVVARPEIAEPSSERIARLLSRRQVAQRWGCCDHTVARRKDLKPIRFNKRLIRYRLEDILSIEAAAAV
jgi:hypothetical protein